MCTYNVSEALLEVEGGWNVNSILHMHILSVLHYTYEYSDFN